MQDLFFYTVCVCVCVCTQSCLMLCDPMDCSPPTPLSTEFSRQEYWSDLPLLPPVDLPDPGIELTSPVSCIGRQILDLYATWEASLYTQGVVIKRSEEVRIVGFFH